MKNIESSESDSSKVLSKCWERIVPRRRVTSQTSNEPLRKPKTCILLYVREEYAALTVGLKREQPEEELVLFRYVLFTVWTSRQSEVDMKYFNPLKPELNPICYLLALL